MKRWHGVATGLVACAVAAATTVPLFWPSNGRKQPVVALGVSMADLPRPDWVVRNAEIDERRDERSSGLVLRHQLLRLKGVERPKQAWAALGSGRTFVYTQADELKQRVNDVLDGVVPVNRGAEATFAVGRLVRAELVRLGPDGKVAEIEDVRVAFVALSTP